MEAMMTFVLIFTLFGTAVHPPSSKIGGFAIGLAVAVDVVMAGDTFTGIAMNPAKKIRSGGNFCDLRELVRVWDRSVHRRRVAAHLYIYAALREEPWRCGSIKLFPVRTHQWKER